MVIIQKISGFRSRVINALIDAVARNRPVGGPGLLTTQSPGGTVISLARQSGAPADEVQLPWTADLYNLPGQGWTVYFRRCGYVRGPVMRFLAEDPMFPLDDPPAGGEGDYWIGVTINTITGTTEADLLCSRTPWKIFDDRPPEDEFFRKPLYTFTYTAAKEATENELAVPSLWAIKDGWYRLLPELGAWV